MPNHVCEITNQCYYFVAGGLRIPRRGIFKNFIHICIPFSLNVYRNSNTVKHRGPNSISHPPIPQITPVSLWVTRSEKFPLSIYLFIPWFYVYLPTNSGFGYHITAQLELEL